MLPFSQSREVNLSSCKIGSGNIVAASIWISYGTRLLSSVLRTWSECVRSYDMNVMLDECLDFVRVAVWESQFVTSGIAVSQ